VIFDLSTSPTVDVTAGLMLGSLQQELAAAGIQLRFANAHASVRDLVRAGGGEARIGEVSRKLSLDGVVQSVLAEAPGSHARIARS
jgi:MFS superfamily sulfate permease-like transporter